MKRARRMKTFSSVWLRGVLTAVILAGTGVLWAEGSEAPPPAQQRSWEDYGLLMQRNIFSRNRGRRPERTSRNEPQETPAPVVLAPESYMVLKGIVAAGTTSAAFIEDTRTNQVFCLTAGEKIASGTVTQLTLDSIVYKQGDRETTILVGQTLSGGCGQTVLTFENMMQWSTTASSTTSSSSTTTEPPSEDEAEILKKLLERRKQELGG